MATLGVLVASGRVRTPRWLQGIRSIDMPVARVHGTPATRTNEDPVVETAGPAPGRDVDHMH